MNRRELAVNIALSCVTLGVGVAGLEAFFRIAYPIRTVIYQLDDRVLFKLVPNARRRFVHQPQNGGESILVTVNSRGFRGRELSEPKRGPRIVVYGDSFIEAEFSREEETFVAELGEALSAKTGIAKIETVNAGVVGYGPDQVALRIEDELDPLAPDLVIVAVFVGNDFGELARNRLFRLGADGALVPNHAVIGPKVKKTFDDARRAAQRPAIVRALKAAFDGMEEPSDESLLDKARARYVDESLARQKRDYVAFVEEKSNIVENLFVDTYDADVALEPDGASTAWKATAMAGVLARIDRVARAHQVPWLLVVIPDPIDVAADYDLSVDRGKHPSYDPRRLSSLVVKAAEANAVAHVDLYDTLRETRATGRLFFRHGDNHWNAAGEARAAEAVAAAIVSRGWLTQRSRE